MNLNVLKPNGDKTEMLVITSRPCKQGQSLDVSIKVGDQYLCPSDDPPKNLGVVFNRHAASEVILLMFVDR